MGASGVTADFLNFAGLVILGVISYFLKRSLSDLDTVKAALAELDKQFVRHDERLKNLDDNFDELLRRDRKQRLQDYEQRDRKRLREDR